MPYFLTKEERAALPEDVFGDPKLRLFPIQNTEDVRQAAIIIEKMPDSDVIRDRIVKIATERGYGIPPTLQTTAQQTFAVEFDAGIPENTEPKLETDPDLGPVVIKTGKIFEAGEYKDKKYQMSPEEMLLAVKNFKPVPMNDSHNPNSFLNGKWGKVRSIEVADNGWDLNGEVAVPVWLNEATNGEPIKISAEWNRAEKILEKAAYVKNPRVSDAAIYAAFTANEIAKDETMKDFLKKWFEDRIEKFAVNADDNKTYSGQSVIQCIHDETARAGAVCDPNAGTATNHTSAELAVIQSLHDLAIAGGADCKFLDESPCCGGYPSYFSKTPDQSSGKTDKKKGTIMGKIAEFKGKISELLGGLPSDDEVAAHSADPPIPTPTPTPAPVPTPPAPTPPAPKAEEAKAAGMSAEEKKEIENLRAEVVALKEDKLKNAASSFADELIKSERAFPAQRSTIVASFIQASRDDEASVAKVSFSLAGKEVEGSRVEAYKALFVNQRPHNLTKESLAAFGGGVIPTDETANLATENEAAKKAAEEYADNLNRRFNKKTEKR